MEVGAKDVFVAGTLEMIFAVIAPTSKNFAQRLSILSQIGAPTVILIANQDFQPRLLEVAFQGHMCHKARATCISMRIKQANAFEFRSLEWLVVVAHELIARTHTQ